jgi:hypothetical protein
MGLTLIVPTLSSVASFVLVASFVSDTVLDACSSAGVAQHPLEPHQLQHDLLEAGPTRWFAGRAAAAERH